MSLITDWKLNVRKLIYHDRSLGLRIFVKRLVPSTLVKYLTKIHKFKLSIEKSNKKKPIYLVNQENANFLRKSLDRMFRMVVDSYKNNKKGNFIQMDLHVKVEE